MTASTRRDGIRRPRMLSAAFCRTVNRPGRYGDGRGGLGLSLLVKTTLNGRWSKTWSQRLRIAGKPFNVGLGRYPLVMLSEARQKALENARAVQQGRDPRARRMPTFGEAAERVITLYEPTWTGARSAQNWRSSLRDYALPTLGRLPVSNVTTQHVLAVLAPIWNEKRTTARLVKQRVSAIMKWAIAEGLRGDDPAGDAIASALPKSNGVRHHMRALPHGQVAAALAKIRASMAWVSAKLALEFVVLTAARSGEVRGAVWDEINLNEAVWTVPASRMKAKREHRVPLGRRAIDVLREAQSLGDESGIVFLSVRGSALADSTLSKMLRDLRIDGVVHGFRSSFRDWAGDAGQPRELAEAALAHVVPNQAEAAYARSDLFNRRRQLMDDWAAYIAS